jgi:two-component system OmpR family response regulator
VLGLKITHHSRNKKIGLPNLQSKFAFLNRKSSSGRIFSANCDTNKGLKPILGNYGSSETMRVLLVEDDSKTASFISKGLKEAGFSVDHSSDGERGLHMALTEPYDAAIVDIMLPKVDGLTLIETLRQQKVNTPVIILSAKRAVDDRVKGLQRGGDDYLTKPFAFSELLARVQGLIRRSSGISEPTSLTCRELSMDLLTREVARGGKEIDLQPLEFALLEYLMRNQGRVVSKTMIMEHVWNYNFDPQTNIVEARICRLRDKVDKGFGKRLIHTIRGVGYVLKETS